MWSSYREQSLPPFDVVVVVAEAERESCLSLGSSFSLVSA
jgi:hypothetical protein